LWEVVGWGTQGTLKKGGEPIGSAPLTSGWGVGGREKKTNEGGMQKERWELDCTEGRTNGGVSLGK